MWSVAVRWAVGGKKGKKKSRPFHAEPRSFTDARHSSIGFPLESSGPSSGTRDDNHNRETARISAPFVPIHPSRSTPNFASFLLFLSFYFSFFPNRKNARKNEKRIDEIVGIVTSYIFVLRESRRNDSSGETTLASLRPYVPFPPFDSRVECAIYEKNFLPPRFSSKYGKSIFEKVGNGWNARNF